MSQNVQLQHIDLELLIPHPQNPRVVLREDVVESIRVSLEESGSMSAEHALRVRPQGDTFQILAGHQRHEAAKRAGLQTIPCWVRELSDEDAYMALILDNRQGELSPLEIGIHALGTIDKGSPGRGKKGGIAQYAREVGKTQQYLSQLVAAAEVCKSTT